MPFFISHPETTPQSAWANKKHLYPPYDFSFPADIRRQIGRFVTPPISLANPLANQAMQGGMRSIDRGTAIAVLDRIVVQVIEMPAVIGVVPNHVLVEAALP